MGEQKQNLNLLTINSGSSSVKLALYEIGNTETRRSFANVERIGSSRSRIEALLTWIGERASPSGFDGVGHRVVVGDRRCIEPQRITEQLLSTFRELADLAPDHLPQVIEEITTITRAYPGVPQAACFDSAFHARMPTAAQMYALPRRLFEQGILRYGFHGLSCEYIVQKLGELDSSNARGRVIIAHLGNGASITAVRDGASIDTSMGFTPLAGLAMGTRCGDLDPGVLLYLMNRESMTSGELNRLLNKESGLLGVSGFSADMRDLLEGERADPRCAEAVAMFCYQARKYIGAYMAALGGLDALVFTGGIGEHSAVIRERICTGMDFMGLRLDAAANASHAPVISAKDSGVAVRVIQTDEDLMIARHTSRVLFPTISTKGGQ